MQMAQVRSVRVPDTPDSLSTLDLSARSLKRFQMPVESFQYLAVWKPVSNDDDFAPARPGFGGENNRSFRDCVDGHPAIRIPARPGVPVFAQMIVLAEILRVIPAVPIVVLRHVSCAADRVVESIR